MKRLLTTVVVAISISIPFLSITASRIENPLPQNVIADRILIEKAKRRLTLMKTNAPLKTYVVALGRHPVGKKTEEGDGKTPEGMYTIAGRRVKSSYHMALHISYPDASDAAQARARGVSPGGAIMIHGLPDLLGFIGRFHTVMDWTLGCVAVTNREIEEIWRAAPDGTPVEIVP